MARPEKNTVEYFPFLCDEGKKMFYIEETYGNDGFSTFIKILRELAKTDFHYLDLSKKTTLMFLSAKCKISTKTLESIINDLVDLDKFDKNLWIENKVIWCQDFIDSIQDAYNKRKNKCITYDGLLQHLCSLGVRKLGKSISQVGVKPQTIVKETKRDKTIEDKQSEFKNSLQPFLVEYDKNMLNDFYLYWTEKKPKGIKMRWEMEKTFDLGRRLQRWNKNNFNKRQITSYPEKKDAAEILLQKYKIDE
tara:strand:+ start:77 stop:823 length:747 start_codon:yes stop_codon:yes gene_type:complete